MAARVGEAGRPEVSAPHSPYAPAPASTSPTWSATATRTWSRPIRSSRAIGRWPSGSRACRRPGGAHRDPRIDVPWRGGHPPPPPSAIEELATRKAHRMRITRDFKPMSDRYGFDFGPCSNANGFAQIDTRQDASYYGTWCSPAARTIVNYCEGDVTTTVCDKHDLRHSFASRAVAVGARACSGLPGAYSPAEGSVANLT